MDIPINVDVHCRDGVCGRSTYVVLNPTTSRITHLVVETKGLAKSEYLVPLDHVTESSPHQIVLRDSRAELKDMPLFMVTDYVSAESMSMDNVSFDPILDMYGGYALWPYNTMGEMTLPAEHEEVPPGELALERGTHVVAKDGTTVGRVDEFLTDPVDGKISHLIMRKGHLWGQRDVTVPISSIDHIVEDKVYLKLDKGAIAALPAMPH